MVIISPKWTQVLNIIKYLIRVQFPLIIIIFFLNVGLVSGFLMKFIHIIF